LGGGGLGRGSWSGRLLFSTARRGTRWRRTFPRAGKDCRPHQRQHDGRQSGARNESAHQGMSKSSFSFNPEELTAVTPLALPPLRGSQITGLLRVPWGSPGGSWGVLLGGGPLRGSPLDVPQFLALARPPGDPPEGLGGFPLQIDNFTCLIWA
jgi:hypothetical protein